MCGHLPRGYVYNILARYIGVLELVISTVVLILLIIEVIGIIPSNGRYSVLIATDIDLQDVAEYEYSTVGNSTAYINEFYHHIRKPLSMKERYIILGTFLYILVEALASVLLIFATVVRKTWYVLPWAICKVIRFMGPIFVSIWYFVAGFELQVTVLITMFINSVFVGVSVAIVLKAMERWPEGIHWCCRHENFHEHLVHQRPAVGMREANRLQLQDDILEIIVDHDGSLSRSMNSQKSDEKREERPQESVWSESDSDNFLWDHGPEGPPYNRTSTSQNDSSDRGGLIVWLPQNNRS
ncbi:uncharacterized protein [Periplaneta americana]|uniref:uncharacterized protein n=1 Tax=Periplaneta americana TaxID=6978 RepID=UPI0037E820CE